MLLNVVVRCANVAVSVVKMLVVRMKIQLRYIKKKQIVSVKVS